VSPALRPSPSGRLFRARSLSLQELPSEAAIRGFKPQQHLDRAEIGNGFKQMRGDSPSAADAFSHFAEHGPVQFESSLVPPSNRFRQDEKERVFPIGPDVARYDPEQFVECPQSWPRVLAFQHSELLAEREVF
jgi:hypothetical protein